MGNLVQNQLCQPQTDEILDKYVSRVGTVNICQFGEVPLYKNEKTNHYFISHECEFLIPSDQKCYQSLQTLRKLNNSCPNLMHIWRILPKQELVGCNGRTKVTVYSQYLPMTLRQVIQSRKASFPEIQIYRLMRSLLTAVRHLNAKESYHGDITPEFIYFDEQGEERYKIFDPVYFNPTRSGYYRAQNQTGYCAPQIVTNLNEKRIYPLYNHYICDTFSIGLVVLYCMTLVDPLVAYRNSKREIDFYYIENLIRMGLKNSYSEGLVACLRECLLVKNRPTVTEILDSHEFLAPEIAIENSKISLKRTA